MDRGIRWLVPLSQLKSAFTSCRPLRIYAMQVCHDTFDVMYNEIFPNASEPSSYHVVGALDSNSQGSNFL
jgi:hypothetical protein